MNLAKIELKLTIAISTNSMSDTRARHGQISAFRSRLVFKNCQVVFHPFAEVVVDLCVENHSTGAMILKKL